MLAFFLFAALAGCSGSLEIGRPKQSPVIPSNATTIIEPNGEEIIQPTETVLQALEQAQRTRTAVRQLAR